MSRTESHEEKFVRMTETPVKKLVITLAIPTIISMLVTAIYNMADTFFVGKIGTSATGAVGVSFSVMAIIQAIGFMFGMGSGNFVTRLLGSKQGEQAKRVAAVGFFTCFASGVLLAILGLVFLDPLVRLLGSTETIAPYAKDYLGIILIGAPFMASSFVMNNLLRFQGSSFYGMIGVTTGGILNMALDPLFIFVFDMGIAGAALATILSQMVGFLILLLMCSKGGNIKIEPKNFKPSKPIYKEIFRLGLPSLYRQGLASIGMLVLNTASKEFGDAAIAAMGVVSKVFQFGISALLGLGQGFQPVSGFNFGAGKYQRVIDAFFFCIKVALVALVIMGVFGIIFAPQIVQLFRDDPEVVRYGTPALRYYFLAFPLSGITIPCTMLTQTIGKSKESSLLALARQGIFFLPLILILPPLIGMLGVQISQPIADVCACILAVLVVRNVVKELRDLAAGKLPAPVIASGEDAALDD